MKHAYLIIAHKVDLTLNTLLELIDDSRNDIFLHMDKKNTTFDSSQLYSLQFSKLHVTKRISVTWGGYSQIECEMILFEAAAKNGRYDYYHLLSGQDLPIKTQDFIHNFFKNNKDKEFINFQSMDFLFTKRVRYYYPFQEKIGRIDSRSKKTFVKLSTFIQRLFLIYRNRHTQYQKGTNWVSVTDCFVRGLIDHKDWIHKNFKYTLCCDEVYKQSFCINYGFRDKLYIPTFDNSCKSMLRLIDWQRGSPYVWTIDDIKQIEESDCIFARKFDSQKDPDVINYLLELKAQGWNPLK